MLTNQTIMLFPDVSTNFENLCFKYIHGFLFQQTVSDRVSIKLNSPTAPNLFESPNCLTEVRCENFMIPVVCNVPVITWHMTHLCTKCGNAKGDQRKNDVSNEQVDVTESMEVTQSPIDQFKFLGLHVIIRLIQQGEKFADFMSRFHK